MRAVAVTSSISSRLCVPQHKRENYTRSELNILSTFFLSSAFHCVMLIVFLLRLRAAITIRSKAVMSSSQRGERQSAVDRKERGRGTGESHYNCLRLSIRLLQFCQHFENCKQILCTLLLRADSKWNRKKILLENGGRRKRKCIYKFKYLSVIVLFWLL